MSGDALVVGDRLVINERALGEVGGGDDDAAWALAIRGAGDVVGGSGGLEGRYGLDRDRRLRKQSEELRKFRLHLGDVVAETGENSARRSGVGFWGGFCGCPGGGPACRAPLCGDRGKP